MIILTKYVNNTTTFGILTTLSTCSWTFHSKDPKAQHICWDETFHISPRGAVCINTNIQLRFSDQSVYRMRFVDALNAFLL